MGKIEWAMWANEQAVITSFVTLVGGILGVAGMFKGYEFGIYGIALGVLVFLFEYPRGRREKGKKTVERSGQQCLTVVLKSLGVFGRNYYIRFVLYLLASVPLGFFLPTLLGAFSLFFTSFIYLRAAIAGETWKPCAKAPDATKTPTTNAKEPPQEPPPRAPGRTRSIDNLSYSVEFINKV